MSKSEPASQKAIESQLDHHVLTLTLNRPAQKNALRMADYSELVQLLDAAEKNDEVRVIILQGQPGVFTAGNDLSAFLNPEQMDAGAPPFSFLKRLNRLAKPLVVAVDGLAIGIGVTLLLHADYVLASTQSWFQMPFVNLGVSPEGGATRLLAERCGYLQAARLLMLGERFDAETAQKLQLVTEVTPAEQLVERLRTVARQLAAQPQAALLKTRQLIRPDTEKTEQLLDQEANSFHQLLLTAECQNRINALLNNRKPATGASELQ